MMQMKNIPFLLISSQGFPSGATIGYAKSQVRDILKAEFNKSVELQVNEQELNYLIGIKLKAPQVLFLV